MVFGGEIDADFNNASGSYINTTGSTSGGSATGDWQASVRGVFGFAGQLAGKPALYYATAGWATGQFDFMGGPAATPTNTYSDTLSGWTAGVGVDWRIDTMTALRLEYRYTDFGTASGTLAPAFPGVTMPVDVVQHAIRFGVRIDF
jgi:outer membrane immunogenic protein